MGKIGKKAQEEFDDIDPYEMTSAQMKLFEKAISKYNSEEEFLIAMKAIIVEDHQMRVQHYIGLKGKIEPITGMIFPTEYPLKFYRRCIEQLTKHDSKVQYAIMKKEEAYQQQAFEEEVINDVNDVEF